MLNRQLLVGTSTPIKLTLEEGKDGKLIAKGEFGRVDVSTQNGRIYGKKVINTNILRMNEALSRRSVYGELDHPSDGKTKLTRASHIVLGLNVTEDGIVNGEAEILSTPSGLILQEILKHGGLVGVSSRGFGTTTPVNDGSGNHKVNEDYILKTYDFVADPAMATAYPDIFTEDTDDDIMRENGFTVESLKTEFPRLVAVMIENTGSKEITDKDIDKIIKKGIKDGKNDLEKSIREEYESKLVKLTVTLKEEAKKTALKELDEDPEHVGAKIVLQRISEMVAMYGGDSDLIAIKDAMETEQDKNKDLETQLESATSLAVIAAYELIVERRIGSHPFLKNIRSALGNLLDYLNVEKLNEAIDSLVDEFKDVVAQKNKEEGIVTEESNALNEEMELKSNELIESMTVKHEEDILILNETIKELRIETKKTTKHINGLNEENNESKEMISELTEAIEISNLEAYKYKSIMGKANPTVLLKHLKNAEDMDRVDEIIEDFGAEKMGDGRLEEMRNKIRRGNKRLTEDTENPVPKKKTRALNIPMGHGLNMNEFNRMSGNKN